MRRRLAFGVGIYLVGSLLLWAAVGWLARDAAADVGLTRSLYSGSGFNGPAQVIATTPDIDLAFLEDDPSLPRRFFSVRWQGFWYAPAQQRVDLYAGADDRVVLRLDAETILEQDLVRGIRSPSREVLLTPGLHRLEVEYEQYGGDRHLAVRWAPQGRPLRPLERWSLFPEAPDDRTLGRAQRVRTISRLMRAFWLGGPVALVFVTGLWPAVRWLGRLAAAGGGRSGPASSGRSVVLLVGVIVAVAVAARCWGIWFGLPHTLVRPDEGFSIGVATSLLEGRRSEFYAYPHLFGYGLALLYTGYFSWGFVSGAFQSLADTAASWHTYWAPFFLLGRLLSACAGAASVMVLYRLGVHAYGRNVGLVSAFFLSVAFLHVRDSHFATVDVAMTLWILLSVLYGLRGHVEHDSRAWVWAGVFGGLAMGTKYNGLLLLAVPAASVMIDALDRRTRRAAALFDRRVLLFAVPFVLVFFLAAPFIWLDPGGFFDAMKALQVDLRLTPRGPAVENGWIHHVTTSLRHGLGWPLLILAAAGLAVTARLDVRRTAMVFAFPTVYYLVAGSLALVYVRYMVPMVPFLCLSAAVATVWASERLTTGRTFAQRGAITAGLAVAVGLPSLWSVVQFDLLLAKTDSRVLAARWFQDHVPVGSTVLQGRSPYGSVQFDRRANYVQLRWDERVGQPATSDRRVEASPQWIIVRESPLPYSGGNPDVTGFADARYELAQVFRGSGTLEAGNVFDLQDAFFMPYAGFNRVERPGPNIYVYQRLNETGRSATPQPGVLSYP